MGRFSGKGLRDAQGLSLGWYGDGRKVLQAEGLLVQRLSELEESMQHHTWRVMWQGELYLDPFGIGVEYPMGLHGVTWATMGGVGGL